MNEYWETYHDKIFQVNDTKDTAMSLCTYGMHARGTIYGHNKTNIKTPCIYKWTIKIIDMVGLMYIGIDASNGQYLSKDFSDWHINKYAFYAFNRSKGVDCKRAYTWSKNTSGWGQDDILRFELNTKEKTFSLYQGDKKANEFEDVEDKEYRFAVYSFTKGDSVQIMDFQIVSLEQ